MATVLVTGAAGFLGAALTRKLLADNHDVIALDVVPPAEAWRLDLDTPGLEYKWISIHDLQPGDIPTHVVHCAAPTNVNQVAQTPRHAAHLAVDGTVAVLEAARRSGRVERFVHISTHSVYGNQPVQPIPEYVKLRPGTLYGALKAAQEIIALTYYECYDMPVVVIRSATLFGVFERSGALVRTFLERVRDGKPIILTGDGSQSRDLSYIDNTVEGVLLALFTHDRNVPGKILNIGSGQDVPIRVLAEQAIRLMDGDAGLLRFGPPRPGEEGRLSLDLSEARHLLGYDPPVSFEEGLRRTAAWVKELRRC